MGIGVAIVIAILHFALIAQNKFQEFLLMVFLLLIGTVVDSAFIHFSVLQFKAPNPFSPSIAPLWIMGDYLLFSTTINNCLKWLAPYPLFTAILGGLFGALTYRAGAALGAAEPGLGIYSY